MNKAAAQIPMKRELKVTPHASPTSYAIRRCSPNPYEEGTESPTPVKGCGWWWCCSPNPYEEGTERHMLFLLKEHYLIKLQPKSL